MNDVNVKWAHGPEFAEVAEALSVPTDQIMGVMAKGDVVYAMYTQDGDERIWRACLIRAVDGVLFFTVNEPSELTFADITEGIERGLEDKLGPPS